jgi:ribonucleoside-diphosphate reductase beta chain
MVNWDDPLAEFIKPSREPSGASEDNKNTNPVYVEPNNNKDAIPIDIEPPNNGSARPLNESNNIIFKPRTIEIPAFNELTLQKENKINIDKDSLYKTHKPISVKEKRLVTGGSAVNQLLPLKYEWGYTFYKNSMKNHWGPDDIGMSQDLIDYRTKLTEAEQHVFQNTLAYLSTADILAMRNIGLAVMEKMTAPEIQLYQARQVAEEAVHSVTYQLCIENLEFNQEDIYNRYRTIPEIAAKINFSNQSLEAVLNSNMDLSKKDNLIDFLESYFFFAGIFEGMWFYNGFSPIFSLQRRGLMKATSEQLQYILRDEVLHTTFGLKVIREIMDEENVYLDHDRLASMVKLAEELEYNYIKFILKDNILGYSVDDHMGHFKFLANRAMEKLGYSHIYSNANPTLTWLDEQVNIRKEKNFFETRVMEYQSAHTLDW